MPRRDAAAAVSAETNKTWELLPPYKKNKLQKKMSKNALKTLYTNNKLEDKVARFIRAIDCTTSVWKKKFYWVF